MKHSKSYTIAADCLTIAGLLFLLCSCLSFNIGDWPSSFVYPHNNTALNFCGIAGAFCAYYLMYFIGPGVFVLLLSLIIFLIGRLLSKPVNQPWLRAAGLILLTVAVSATFYCLWPDSIYNFPMGSGGLLGIATIIFLRSHFAILGTFILISTTWIVGIILLADSFVMMILRSLDLCLSKTASAAGSAISIAKERSKVTAKIWQKLSLGQKKASRHTKPSSFKKDHEIEGVPDKHSLANKKIKVMAAASGKTITGYIPPSYVDFELPPLDLLEEPEYSFSAVQGKVVKAKAAALEQLLAEFNINAQVVAAETGPVSSARLPGLDRVL